MNDMEFDDAIRARRDEWRRTYFDHDRARHRVQHHTLDEILSTQQVPSRGTVSTLTEKARDLPRRFNLPGTQAKYLSVAPLDIAPGQFFELIGTEGLLVWHDGHIVHQHYREGHEERTPWMTNSASKLVVAMLVACAQADGRLDDDSLLVSLWPELRESGWDAVTIGHCRSMTTGVAFEEESLDLEGDSQFAELLGEVAYGSIDRFVAGLGRLHEPGTVVRYSSLDTEALGGALIRATGRGIAEYLTDVIWTPAGMEHDAYWVCDPLGREMALSGLCATLRDYARIGLILLHDGRWNGRQIVPVEFAQRLSSPPPELFEMAGHDDYPLLVADQAFIPSRLDEQGGDYMAAGSYGQLIYVNPATRTVVAHHGVGADITMEYVDMHRAFMAFRQIAEHLG